MTNRVNKLRFRRNNFNPHEREARDPTSSCALTTLMYFNPHEREARDLSPGGIVSLTPHFNPHEREARDYACPRL